MPKFRVKGCFKENAEDVEIIIEAASYKDAERIANQKGILVNDVLVENEPSDTTKNCITCEGKVSTNATTCPHCGEPNPARQEETKTQFDRVDSPKRGVSKTHSVSAIAKSLLDSAVDIGASSSASPETSSIPNDVVLFLEDDKKRRNKKNTIALIFFVIFICFLITGNFHIISDSEISFPKIVKKESFGFKETFINIDEITSMPAFSAQSLHPIGIRVLQRLGYIESNDEHRGRIKKEAKEEMDKAVREAQKEMNKALGINAQ